MGCTGFGKHEYAVPHAKDTIMMSDEVDLGANISCCCAGLFRLHCSGSCRLLPLHCVLQCLL